MQLPRLYQCTEVCLVVRDKAQVGAVYFCTGNISHLVWNMLQQSKACLLGSTSTWGVCLVLRDTASVHFGTRKPLLWFPNCLLPCPSHVGLRVCMPITVFIIKAQPTQIIDLTVNKVLNSIVQLHFLWWWKCSLFAFPIEQCPL